jgi:hypothetical protein
MPVPADIITNSKRNTLNHSKSNSIERKELLRDQMKLEKKFQDVEKQRVELNQIMHERKTKTHNFEPDTLCNDQSSVIDDTSENEEEEAPVPHPNVFRTKSAPRVARESDIRKSESDMIKTDNEYEMQNTETEDDACSIDLEYQDRLLKEQELNNILKRQENQLLQKRKDIEEEIKSRKTEVGSPNSFVDSSNIEIENRPVKSMSVGRYTMKKHRPKEPNTLRSRAREPLGSSSVVNTEQVKKRSHVFR